MAVTPYARSSATPSTAICRASADSGVEDTRTLEEIGDAHRRTEGGAYAGAGFGEVRLYGGDGGVLFVVDIPMEDWDGTPETVR